MKRAAELVETMVRMRIDVYGFDAGRKLPKPEGYRDLPNLFFTFFDGQYPMDRKELKNVCFVLG